MSIYQYSELSLLDKVVFKATANGAVRAYLHARQDATPESLRDLTEALQAHDWQCIPYTLDGQPTLEVRGFGQDYKLLQLLGGQHAIEGAGSFLPDKQDAGFLKKLKKRSLQASGAAYAVGDVNFFRYGLKEGRWEDMLAGITYAGGTATLLGYGRNDQSIYELKELAQRTVEHLAKDNVQASQDCALSSILAEKHKNSVQKLSDFFKHYPAEMFNLFTGLAGACIAASALRYKVLRKAPASRIGHEIESQIFSTPSELKKFRTAGWLDVGLGTITMASTAIGGLVEEKAHDPDQPKAKGWRGMMEWVRQRPLSVAGIGLMGSTSLHAVSSVLEYRQCQRLHYHERLSAIKNRGWFVFSNLLAEALVAISSKGHGEGVVNDKSVDTSVIALTADMIVKQPLALQDHLIDYMTPFLGDPKVLAMKDEEVKDLLRQQVEHARQNPWACEGLVPLKPQPAAKAQAWQAKLAKEVPASPQLSA